MTAVRSFESELLHSSEALVASFAQRYGQHCVEARFQLLEAVASRLGGFRLEDFHSAFGICAVATADEFLVAARAVVKEIGKSGIPPALALSALAREKIGTSAQRTSGAFHTDFRLAQRLAELTLARLSLKSRVVDPACGAGILLVALSMKVCGSDRRRMARWLGECVYAADRSPMALRGALLSLASLTSNVSSLVEMRSKWRVGDSLLDRIEDWIPVGGFDVIIANPPWEKVKLSRHEYLKAKGHIRHYGAETQSLDIEGYEREQATVASYSERLAQAYPLIRQGEPDLYVAFCELFDRLCKQGGTISALVPGGLIRSQGTAALRAHLVAISSRLAFSIVENRSRFFGIDSRFKFLAMSCVKKHSCSIVAEPLILRHERGTKHGMEKIAEVRVGRVSLLQVRPDLSIPEVRSSFEWAMFKQLIRNGEDWTDPDSYWCPSFCREVDMTKERPLFRAVVGREGMPVIEGRMVQQHRFGAKAYLSGSGRRAAWRLLPFGHSRVVPQFYLSESQVPRTSIDRTRAPRAGFCDITGQTNERSMMAAVIPEGVVCGNKVPTIVFPKDSSEERLLVWCSIVNSIPFDWLVRRVITTTLNYFLLVSLPLPRLVPSGLPWRRLAACARQLRELDRGEGECGVKLRQAAEIRATIDAEVAVAYGLNFDQLKVMLSDFPLLDRGQPALAGEANSTITRDLLLSIASERMKRAMPYYASRFEQASALGAIAYVPSEAQESLTHQSGAAYVEQ